MIPRYGVVLLDPTMTQVLTVVTPVLIVLCKFGNVKSAYSLYLLGIPSITPLHRNQIDIMHSTDHATVLLGLVLRTCICTGTSILSYI